MKKHIIDENTGISYTLHGEYYLPDLDLPEEKAVGVWGQRHLRFIKEHRRGLYEQLIMTGKVNEH